MNESALRSTLASAGLLILSAGCKPPPSNFEAFELSPAEIPAVQSEAEPVFEALEDCEGLCPGWSRVVFPWHDAGVVAVAASTSGSTIASLSRDGTLRLWSTDGLEPRGVLHVPSSEHMSMSMDEQGRVLAVRQGGAITLVGVSGKRLAEIRPDHDPTAMSFTTAGSGPQLVVATAGGRIETWSLKGERTLRLELDAEPNLVVTALAITPDGKALAVAGRQQEFGWEGVFSWDRGQPIQMLKPKEGSIMSPASSIAVSRDGTLLATGGYELRVWDLQQGRLLATHQPPGNPSAHAIAEVAFAEDDRSIDLVLRASSLARFDPIDSELRPIKTALPFLTAADFPADHPRAVIGGGEGQVHIVDRYDGGSFGQAPRVGAGGLSLAFVSDPNRLVGGMTDGSLRIWDLEQATELERRKAHDGDVNALVLDETGRLWSAGHDGKLLIHGLGDTAAVKTARHGGAPILGLARCGDQVWAGLADGFLERFSASDGNQLQRVQSHDKEITGVAANGDCSLWATSSEDGSVRLWKPQATSPEASLQPELPRAFQDVAFTRSDTLLSVEAFLDQNQLRRWSLDTGHTMHVLTGLDVGAIDLQMLDDGRLLTADLDGAATLRKPSGEPLARFPSTNGHVMAARMSADGRWIALATTGNEATIRVWRKR